MLTFSQSQVEEILKAAKPKKKSVNEITFWYGGHSLLELREMNPELFGDQSWYDAEEFAKEKSEAGMYTVTFCVEGSNNKTFDEQKAMIPKGEAVCPVAVLATAALLAFIETGNDPFNDDWSRCIEQAADGDRVVLGFSEGRLDVGNYYWDDDRYGNVWLSSVRASS